MVLKEFIDTILAKLSGGVQSDDRQIHPRLVYNTMLPIRSRLISQKINKKQKISDWTYQIVPCIKLIEVDSSLCPCLPPRGCSVLRSEKKIPKPLSGLTFMAIAGLYSVDMQVRYQYTTQTEFTRSKGGKYTGNTKKGRYIINDEYLYLYGEDLPEYVVFKAILYDPLKAWEFISACPDPDAPGSSLCQNPLEEEFQIDADLEDTLVELTLNRFLEKFKAEELDLIANNAMPK